jgi:hypothetical protein
MNRAGCHPLCDQHLIAGKRPGCSQAGNQRAVSPTYRNYCLCGSGALDRAARATAAPSTMVMAAARESQ